MEKKANCDHHRTNLRERRLTAGPLARGARSKDKSHPPQGNGTSDSLQTLFLTLIQSSCPSIVRPLGGVVVMPLDRVPGQAFNALVDHADGRRGRPYVRAPPVVAFPCR